MAYTALEGRNVLSPHCYQEFGAVRHRATGTGIAARRQPLQINAEMPRKDVASAKRDVEAQRLVPKATGAAARESSGKPNPSGEKVEHLKPVLLAVVWSAMGAFSFGYHLGVVNGPLAAIAADLGFAGDAALQGLVVSSCLGGAAVGSLTGSGLADSLGRRQALILAAVPMLIGSLLSATAGSLWYMVAGRVAVGIGIGLSSALVPLYISEISPSKIRGTLGSLNQLIICVGILGALLTNVVVRASQWRSMFYLALIPAALLAVGMALSPESPRWQYSKGQTREAVAGANRLWGDAGGDALQEAAPSSQASEPVSVGELLSSKGAIIGVVLFAAQQLSGINAVVYFSSATFAAAGVRSGQLASAVVGTINVLGTVVAASLMDKFGRKQLLSTSFSGMGVAMLSMAAGLGFAALEVYRGQIALTGTILYVAFFALGAGAVPGLIVPELNSARLRGKAVSLAMAVHWIFNLGIGQLFLPAVNRFGLPSVYTFFAAICAVTVLYTKKQVVETKGLSLEEIEAQLNA